MPGSMHPPGTGWVGKSPATTACVLGFSLIVGGLAGFKIQVMSSASAHSWLAGWLALIAGRAKL